MLKLLRNLTAGVAIAGAASAASADENTDLAQQLSNPLASLISVPFQLNYDEGFGTGNGSRWLLNFQPVIPVSLNDNMNLIIRTIVPVISQDDVIPGIGSQSGLGDITQSFFFSPTAPTAGGATWGVGPVFVYPSATDDLLGREKWGAGVTGVVLRQTGPWTVGGLANHIWSFAGDDSRPAINQTFVQPFVSYTTPKATTFSLNSEMAYDWGTDQWTVPINLQVNQMIRLGQQPAQIGAGVRYWAEAPAGGPEGWGFRLNFVLLFPKG